MHFWLVGDCMGRGKALGLCTGWFTQTKAPVPTGCTTFRLNPFRRIDNSSNTTIGLKKGSGTTLRLKKIKDFRRIVAPVLFFRHFRVFLKYLDDLPVVG